MRNLKKVLSLALAFVMLMGLMIVGAGAAVTTTKDYTDAASVTKTEAVDVMSAVGIFNGTDGSFAPQGNLTRAEAAAIITRMLLGTDAANALVATAAPYADVAANNWAAGAILYCTNLGIVSGIGNNQFGPAGQVTGNQFAKMLLVALGYDPDTEHFTGSNWSVNVGAKAYTAGLMTSVEGNMNEALTRELAAQMAFNTLTADMVEYTNKGFQVGDIIVPGSSATKVAHANTSGYVAPFGTTPSFANDTIEQFCERYFPTLKLTAIDTEDDAYGIKTNVWFLSNSASDDVYTSTKKVTTGDRVGVLATYTTEVGDVTKGQLVRLGLSGSVTVKVNGQGDVTIDIGSDRNSNTKALEAYKGATVYVVDTDTDGRPDQINVVYGYLAQVTKVTEASGNNARTVDLKVYNSNAGANVAGYESNSLALDQWVMVYPKAAIGAAVTKENIVEVKSVAVSDVVTGAVTLVSGTNGSAVTGLTVNGSKYNVGGTGLALLAPTTSVTANTYDFQNTYTLFLSNGYVIGVQGEQATANISDIVYVTRESWATVDAYGVNTYYTEVVNMDGTTAILPNVPNRVINVNGATSTYSAPTGDCAGFYSVKDVNGRKEFTALTDKDAITNPATPFGTETLDDNTNMETNTASLVVDSVRAYVTANTRLLFIGTETGANLKVTLVTGAMKQTLAAGSPVLLSKDAAGNYIVEAVILGASLVDLNGEIVYITSNRTGANNVGDLYEMYSQTGVKSEVPVNGSAPTPGFATYSVNDKGEYSFNTNAVAAAATTNGNGKYALSATPVSVYASRQLISTTGLTYNLTDADASGAAIVDLRSNKSISIGSVSDLNGLKVTGSILVRDDKVVTIVVTAAVEPVAATSATYVSTELADASTDEYFEVTIGGITCFAASTVTGVKNQADAWASAYDNSDWAATVAADGAVTLTYKDNTVFDTDGDKDAEGVARASAGGVTGGTFTNGVANTSAATIVFSAAAEVTTTSKVKVTIDDLSYYIDKAKTSKEDQLAAWVAAYNADELNTDYTADTGTDDNASKVVLTAKVAGAKDDNGSSTHMTGGTWKNGTAAV